MSETPDPFDVAVDALEQAAFRNKWRYHPDDTALTAAADAAEIVVRALAEAGCLREEASRR